VACCCVAGRGVRRRKGKASGEKVGVGVCGGRGRVSEEAYHTSTPLQLARSACAQCASASDQHRWLVSSIDASPPPSPVVDDFMIMIMIRE
jgi:hypothetical protein